MAPTGRKPDVIDREIEVGERIRKLEVLTNPRTLIPARWKPDRRELNAITGHVILMSAFNADRELRAPEQGGANADSFGPRIPPASHRLLSGVGDYGSFDLGYPVDRSVPGAALATQFTRFLQYLKALPGPTAWTFHGPSGTYTEDGADGLRTRPVRVLRGGPSFDRKHFPIVGVPEGDWRWAPEGFVVGTGYGAGGYPDSPMPDLGSFAAFDGALVIPAGGLYYATNTQFYARSESRAHIAPSGEQFVCQPSPDTPYTGNPPGIPHYYQATPYPCESGVPGLIEDNVQGYIGRIWVGMSALDERLLSFPSLGDQAPSYDTGGESGSYSQTTAATDIGSMTYPGFWTLFDRVQAALPLFPLVNDWYAQRLPEALAYEKGPDRFNWQALPLYSGWYGRVEVMFENRRIFMRGRVRSYQTRPRDHIAHWSFNLPEPRERASFNVRINDTHKMTCRYTRASRTDIDYGNAGSVITAANPVFGAAPIYPELPGGGYEIVFDGVSLAEGATSRPVANYIGRYGNP